jgi:hypothetical protein
VTVEGLWRGTQVRTSSSREERDGCESMIAERWRKETPPEPHKRGWPPKITEGQREVLDLILALDSVSGGFVGIEQQVRVFPGREKKDGCDFIVAER